MCRLTYLVVPLSIYSSIGTLIAISRDRYYAVIHPMTSLDRRNTKSPLICIWVSSFLFTIPLILVSRIEHGYCTEVWPKPFLSDFYWIVAFCVQFAIPVCLLAVAHVLIILHLKQLKLPSESHYRSRVQARRRQQQRMIVMSVTLVLAYVICMLPQHLIFFWMSFGNLQTQPYNMYIFQVANLMLMLNSALNPVVYGTLNNDIKRGFVSVFKRGGRLHNRIPNWSRKTIELQSMASYYASPLLQKRSSRQSTNGSESFDSAGWSKKKGLSFFSRNRSRAVNENLLKQREAKKLHQDEASVILEKKERNGNKIEI